MGREQDNFFEPKVAYTVVVFERRIALNIKILDYCVLEYLIRRESYINKKPISATRISNHFGITRPTYDSAIKRLQKKKLISLDEAGEFKIEQTSIDAFQYSYENYQHTKIFYDLKKRMQVDFVEYCLMDIVYYYETLERGCELRKVKLSNLLGITEREVYKMLNKLEGKKNNKLENKEPPKIYRQKAEGRKSRISLCPNIRSLFDMYKEKV